MRKKVLTLVATLGVLVGLTGCCMSHEWADATCTEPKTCTKCGKTEGEALGHQWVEATCTEPKHCSVCGETEGEPIEHTWVDTVGGRRCTVCGYEEIDESVTTTGGIENKEDEGTGIVQVSEFDLEMEKIFDAEGTTGVSDYLKEHQVDFNLAEFLGRDLPDYYFVFISAATNEELEEDLSDGYYDDENGTWQGFPAQTTISEPVLNGDFNLQQTGEDYLVQYIYNSPYVELQPEELLYLLKDKYPGLVTNYLPDESLGFEFPYDGKTAIGFRSRDMEKTGLNLVYMLKQDLFVAATPDDKFGEKLDDLSGERAMFGKSLMTDGTHEHEQADGDGIPDILNIYRDSNGVLKQTVTYSDGTDTTFLEYCICYIAHDFGAISDENWQKVVDIETEYGNSLEDVEALLGVQ